MAATFTLNEAGFLIGRSTAAINRAIDRKEVPACRGSAASNGARRVGRAELRALAVIGALEKDLTPAGRRKASAAVRKLPADRDKVDLGAMELRLHDLDAKIDERLARLQKLRDLVEPQQDGDPLIRGTRSSVYAVAAFTQGQTIEEIMMDCKGLTPELIEAAVEYAEVYPRAGRPLPTRSFKRMLIDLGNSGVWGVEVDDEPIVR